MKKSLWVVGAMVCAPVFAAHVFEASPFGTKWQNCATVEALEVLKAKAPKGLDVNSLAAVGSAYERGRYIVDFKHGGTDMHTRVVFRGDYHSSVKVFDPNSNSTKYAYQCMVDASGLTWDETAFIAYDRETPAKVYVTVYGKEDPAKYKIPAREKAQP